MRFTPAEDDLLLRGLVSLGIHKYIYICVYASMCLCIYVSMYVLCMWLPSTTHMNYSPFHLMLYTNTPCFPFSPLYIGDDWVRIKQELLPAKDEQLLQFRFRQLTASDVPDNRHVDWIYIEPKPQFFPFSLYLYQHLSSWSCAYY